MFCIAYIIAAFCGKSSGLSVRISKAPSSNLALSLALFAWLLSLHPDASGRVYAAYGGVYICVALLWLWVVDGVKLTMWDVIGGAVALLGMAIIIFAPKSV